MFIQECHHTINEMDPEVVWLQRIPRMTRLYLIIPTLHLKKSECRILEIKLFIDCVRFEHLLQLFQAQGHLLYNKLIILYLLPQTHDRALLGVWYDTKVYDVFQIVVHIEVLIIILIVM